jgi:cytidylate kinase
LKKITIAIDGFSSTGKSTVAKQLAQKLHYVYVDTGAMYRAVTLFAIKHNLISEQNFDKITLLQNLNNIKLEFVYNQNLGYSEIFLNNKNVDKEIRNLKVSNFVSTIAKVPEIRKKLVEQQQLYGVNKGVVMDGRDIGTVVFPDAELKIFMTASPEIRAKRRYNELILNGEKVSYIDIFQNVVQRDATDTSRKDSPLVKAKDAIEIDNSSLSQSEQFEIILKLALEKIQEN